MLLAVAACVVAEVAVSSAGAAFLNPSACLQNVPYTPPHEGWSAEAHWSWIPLGAGCTYLNLEDGDVVVVDDTRWASSLTVGAVTLTGVFLLTRTVASRAPRARPAGR